MLAFYVLLSLINSHPGELIVSNVTCQYSMSTINIETQAKCQYLDEAGEQFIAQSNTVIIAGSQDKIVASNNCMVAIGSPLCEQITEPIFLTQRWQNGRYSDHLPDGLRVRFIKNSSILDGVLLSNGFVLLNNYSIVTRF